MSTGHSTFFFCISQWYATIKLTNITVEQYEPIITMGPDRPIVCRIHA